MIQTFKTVAKYGVVLATAAASSAFAALPSTVSADLTSGKGDVTELATGFLLMSIVVGIFAMYKRAGR